MVPFALAELSEMACACGEVQRDAEPGLGREARERGKKNRPRANAQMRGIR